MQVSFRDISTKKRRTMTQILIWKKSINEKTFIDTIHNYLCVCGYTNCHCDKGYFIWCIPSTINLKYICRENVSRTEVLFDEFKKNYYKRMEAKYI